MPTTNGFSLELQGKIVRTRGRVARVADRHYGRRMPSPRRTALGAWKQAQAQQAPLLAAGVAFYAFLSLFPAMIAGVNERNA